AASPAWRPRHRDAGPLTSPDSPGNELFNNPRREESPRSPRLGGRPARPSSAGAPPSPSPKSALGSAKEARAPAGGLLLPLRLAVRSSVRGPGAVAAKPRACFGSPEPSGSFSKTPRPGNNPPRPARLPRLNSNSGTQRGKPPERSGSFPRLRDPRLGWLGGSRFEPLRKQVIRLFPPKTRSKLPPLSEPFHSAHNKCARHRMHHLPPQICALMGRQIAVRVGHIGRPVPALPACLYGAPECAPPGCARRVWMDMRVCQWMVTEQARVLVCMQVCQKSVLQESALVQAHAHTRGRRVHCECLETTEMRLVEGAQRKG
ncbi:hypothetical protein HPG69_005114, partial [Diceros bicornis minor]